jgi:hypothetical protein
VAGDVEPDDGDPIAVSAAHQPCDRDAGSIFCHRDSWRRQEGQQVGERERTGGDLGADCLGECIDGLEEEKGGEEPADECEYGFEAADFGEKHMLK